LSLSIKTFLDEHSFLDGIDLDWEFPTMGGCMDDCSFGEQKHSPNDTENYAALLKVLRSTLGDDKEISVAGPPAEANKTTAMISFFPIKAMAEYIDYVNVMAYDYHGAWDVTTNNLAPLYQDPNDPSDFAKELNVNTAIDVYVKLGMPPEKIVLGVPFYGVGWQVSEAGLDGTGLFVPGTKITDPAPDSAANYKYSTIVDDFLNGDAVNNPALKWNDSSQSAVFYDGSKMISLDSPKTMQAKADYILGKGPNKRKLKGAMYWDLAQDSCDKNSLSYHMSKSLGRPGTVLYECKKQLSLQVSNLSKDYGVEVTIADGTAWHKLDYLNPGKNQVYDDGVAVTNLSGKSGLQVLVNFAGNELWCSKNGAGAASQPGANLTFDFNANINVMVNPSGGPSSGGYKLSCEFSKLP
ncbi:MAG: glycosyl hydrolase family 18 protein, partial [Gallionellaceae bacterium]